MSNYAHLGNLNKDALADDLERLAQALRDGEVTIRQFDVEEHGGLREMTEKELWLSYNFQAQHSDIFATEYGQEADDA